MYVVFTYVSTCKDIHIYLSKIRLDIRDNLARLGLVSGAPPQDYLGRPPKIKFGIRGVLKRLGLVSGASSKD